MIFVPLVFTAPESQGHGYASALLRKIGHIVRSLSIPQVVMLPSDTLVANVGRSVRSSLLAPVQQHCKRAIL